MKHYRPRSIIQLTLIGFTCVAAPLIAALVLTLLNVERMADISQRTILNMTQVMQLSQQLGKEITEMERYARQFLLLKDDSIYQLYQEEHEEFTDITEAFKGITTATEFSSILLEIRIIEADLYAQVSNTMMTTEQSVELFDMFGQLSVLGRRLLQVSNRNIEKQTRELQVQATGFNNLLYIQSMILIPVAFLLAVLFTILITRPLRQMDRSIRKLGSGNLSDHIRISGPSDLEELGIRLEWLRMRLEELEAQKVAVLRHISHDLKTPLTALREGVELLSEGVPGELNHNQKEIIWILKSNAVKLQQQVEELLNYSATGNILNNSIRQNVAVHELMKEVIKEHILEIKTKKLTFKGQVDDTHIQADPSQIRVILDNIFSNAIKYSPRNGRIIALLKTIDDEMVLDVLDQGPGIAEEERERVFEAFYQGRTASKGHVKGTGLGLAIAQEFAQLHKGAIETISESVGAHFRLTLARES